MFNAILPNKNGDGTTNAQVTQLDDADLPADGAERQNWRPG
jgi:acrylyl-CoA reductase (NADPH)